MSQTAARAELGSNTSDSHVTSGGAAREGTGRWLPATGLWLVPAGALLIGLHWFFPEGPRTAEGIARHFTSPVTVFVQEFLLFEGGLVVLLFGVMALGDYLAAAGAPRWGQGARILSVTAIAMFLPAAALPTQILPGLGELFLSGHPEVGIVFDAFSRGHYGASFPVMFSVVAAAGIAAAVAMGVAGWRSRAIPRWCSIAYPIGFVLNLTDAPVIAWVGLALMLVTGTVIARGSKQRQIHSGTR